MRRKLPADFDPARYSAAYPDVALSGLDPADHYLRFGRLMGRSASGRGAAAAPREPTKSAPKGAPPDMVALGEQAQKKPGGASDRPPVIDRPDDFTAAHVVPAPAPQRHSTDDNGLLSLEALASGPFASAEDKQRLSAPLFAYARMFSLEAPEHPSADRRVSLSQARLLRSGDSRITNAWFAEARRLRLMIGGSGGADVPQGWALRAYQSLPDRPAELRLAGAGVLFPVRGPIFHDVELVHPLMPVLLELADAEGTTRDLTLLPFPSLLPGGIHGTELRALQNAANPMDAFWSLSELLMRELLEDGHSDQRAIAELGRHDDGETDIPVWADLREWLATLFGLELGSSAAKQGSSGLRLLLPRDSIPSISALVSRGLGAAAEATVAPFLVAEQETLRPRWSVVLPADSAPSADLPVLYRPGGGDAVRQESIPIPVSIVLRPADGVSISVIAAEDRKSTTSALTAVVDVSDLARTESLIRSLTATAVEELEIIVRTDVDEEPLRQTLDALCGAGGWTATAPDADLRELARAARHEIMLTISDRVQLKGSSVLAALDAILRQSDDVASASCALLGEATFKKATVLQPASGGLFPSHVSFASAPGLAFSEPDVLQALPNLTYSVVANTFLLTLWRRNALFDLPHLDRPIPASHADISIGLGLLAAGFRNLCTSRVSATLVGPHARRDTIDPLGAAHVSPDRWADILPRVTLLRELF